jgi:hypothetical protein
VKGTTKKENEQRKEILARLEASGIGPYETEELRRERMPERRRAMLLRERLARRIYRESSRDEKAFAQIEERRQEEIRALGIDKKCLAKIKTWRRSQVRTSTVYEIEDLLRHGVGETDLVKIRPALEVGALRIRVEQEDIGPFFREIDYYLKKLETQCKGG